MPVMPEFVHPRLEEVSLAAALHALADPVRLTMVATLAQSPDLNCAGTGPCDIPKSTLSNHFKLLRAAGLVETRAQGRDLRNTLRREEFDARFPGLLQALLANRPT